MIEFWGYISHHCFPVDQLFNKSQLCSLPSYSGFLPQPKDLLVMLSGDSRSSIYMNIIITITVFTVLLLNQWPVWSSPYLSPYDTWDSLTPTALNWVSGKRMDGYIVCLLCSLYFLLLIT